MEELKEVEAGDELVMKYEVEESSTGKEAGEEVELRATVKFNTIGSPEDHMFGREAMEAVTSEKRFGLKAVVDPDGSLEVRPVMNGNGKVDRGSVVQVGT